MPDLSKTCIRLKPGDRVVVRAVRSGLSGGSCRVFDRVVQKIDFENDKVYFRDGSTYNHEENPDTTLCKAESFDIGADRE